MAVNVKCKDHMDKVRTFARENGIEEALDRVLDYLGSYGGGECECDLFHDFAPQSFSFVMKRDGRFWFNGGAIFDARDKAWSVHT